jgi:hypothetical protein
MLNSFIDPRNQYYIHTASGNQKISNLTIDHALKEIRNLGVHGAEHDIYTANHYKLAAL